MKNSNYCINTFGASMRRFSALILALSLTSFSARAQLTLKDAAANAIKVNNGLKSSELKIRAKDYSIQSARGRYMPEIGVDFKYTYLDDDLILDLDPIRSAMIELQSGDAVSLSNLESVLKQQRQLTPEEQLAVKRLATQKLDKALPHFQETLKEQAVPQATITLKQPIFTGGKILAGINASKAQKGIETAKLNGEREDVVFDAVTSYVKVLFAEENEKVRKEMLDGVRRHAYMADKMMEQGLIAKHDKLRADVALSSAEQNLFEATEKRKIAQIVLLSLLQSSADSVSLSDRLTYKGLDKTLPQFLSMIAEGNSTLQQLQSSNAALDEKSKAEFSNYLPTVYGFGFYNVFDHYVVKNVDPKWGIGLGANFTVFDGLRRKYNYQEARAESESIRLMTDEVHRKLELLTRSRFMEMKLAEDRYMQLDASLEQAEENLKLNEKRFDTGMGTSLEAIDARLALEGIKLMRIKSLNDYYQNMAELFKTVGRLDEFIEFWYSQQ